MRRDRNHPSVITWSMGNEVGEQYTGEDGAPAMAHILPHWTWPERRGQVTPVHVTSGDEAELFLNGRSLGRRKKAAFEYRLRWDDVVYEPGRLEVIAYKERTRWAAAEVRTAGEGLKEGAATITAVTTPGRGRF